MAYQNHTHMCELKALYGTKQMTKLCPFHHKCDYEDDCDYCKHNIRIDLTDDGLNITGIEHTSPT